MRAEPEHCNYWVKSFLRDLHLNSKYSNPLFWLYLFSALISVPEIFSMFYNYMFMHRHVIDYVLCSRKAISRLFNSLRGARTLQKNITKWKPILTITRLIDVGVLLVAFPNDSFSLCFTDCHKIGSNKKDIGSALAEHVQTCLFTYDSLSFIYY